MKNKKVLNLRTHVGGLHGKTSYDVVKDKAKMDLTPVGVLVEMPSKVQVLIPYSNCTEIIVEDCVEEEQEKRGPGRPPKAI